MGHEGSITRKIFAGISVVLGVTVLGISAWLLTVSLGDDQCKNYDRNNYFNRDNRDSRDYGRTQYNRGQSWSDFGRVRGYGSGRDFYEGRNLEDYCVYVVDNWTLAGGIGVGIGLIQILLSAGYFFTAFGYNPSAPKAWTMSWIICHILFAGGLMAALFFGVSGDVQRYHNQTRRVGPMFLAACGVDGALSLLFAVLVCIFVYRKIKPDTRFQRDSPERPDSRTQFIPNVSAAKSTEIS